MRLTVADPSGSSIGRDFSGFDTLELAEASGRPRRARELFRTAWPKVAAIVLALGFWQFATLFYPSYLLPGPIAALSELADQFASHDLVNGIVITLQRAAIGFAIAVVVGVVLGLLVARSRLLRSAIESLITGLQTMPSIAGFPLAIILFKLSEAAILFVVVLGAAPAIANGLISGIDQVPPAPAGSSAPAAGRHIGT
jgi:NitT/TauT family transport system permease protein